MTQSHPTLRHATNFIIMATAIAGSLLMMLPHEQVKHLNAEGGIIESLSATAAAVCVLLAVFNWLRAPSQVWFAIALAALWMFLRELDCQKLFTPRSIESIGFYSAPSVPLRMKLTAIAALAPFVIAISYLAWRGLRTLQNGFHPFPHWWRPLVVAGSFLAAALASEKLLPPAWGRLEELLELAFMSLILLTVAAPAFDRPCRETDLNTLNGSMATGRFPSDSDRIHARHLDLH